MSIEQLTMQDVKRSLWLRGEISYKLDALQLQITRTVRQNESARKICILSSRQIGKTFWACVYALMYLLRHPRKIARIIAPTYTQCQDLVTDNLHAIIADSPKDLIWPVKSEYRYNLFNGSSLRLGALERAYVDGNRGGNASLIIYEECGFVKTEDFNYGVDSVMGPQLLRSNGVEIFVSSPSEEPDHPLHTKVLPEADQLGTLFQYTVYDSPSITKSQIAEAIRRCGGEHTDAWKREYLAQIIRARSKVVIPGFDPERHVRNFNLPSPAFHHLTADWGGVRDLTVALWHTYDFVHNRILIWNEAMFPRNTGTAHILKQLREWDCDWHVKCADVPGQTLIDMYEMESASINDRDSWVTPPKHDWLAGVQSMANLFDMDQIWIHPRCKFLIRSIRGGVFNKNRTDFERFEEENGIGHCDALAALSYANRIQNRTNPNRFAGLTSPDNVFIVERKGLDSQVAGDIGQMFPNSKFGTAKTFGKFRDG